VLVTAAALPPPIAVVPDVATVDLQARDSGASMATRKSTS